MTGKNKFQIGDKVTIREDSQYFIKGPSNSHAQLPPGIIGTVQGVDIIAGDNWFDVKWPGGANAYGEHDLDLVEAAEDLRLT